MKKKTTKKKSTQKKTAKKKVVVNRKFMLDLADDIYNPKTKEFLRLCDGTLQNGPDPTDEERPMHCGLGELYFAMTGTQPMIARIDEDDVVDKAVELSAFPETKSLRTNAIEQIKKLNLSPDLEDDIIDTLNHVEEEMLNRDIAAFRAALDDIPYENDDGCGSTPGECSVPDFRNRSKRVASKLREAAKLLPT